jgi:Contact-dependent growth inhibition CdiA C-terminal domain
VSDVHVFLDKAKEGFAYTALRGAASSALTQGISVATGLQKSFSWREVALAAVSAPVTQSASEQAVRLTGVPDRVGELVGNVAGSLGGSAVRAITGEKVTSRSLLQDLGSAVGGVGAGLVRDAFSNARLERRVDSLVQGAGVDGNRGDTQFTRIAVKAILASGGTNEQVSELLGRDDFRGALGRLDLVTIGGRSVGAAAELALQFAGSPPSETSPVESEIFSDGQLIPSLTVTGRYSKGESVIGNTIGGGVELLDAFGRLYTENETLATIGFIGVSAVLGGPTKTILKRIAGETGENLVERGAEAFGSLVGRAVTSIATRHKFTIAFTIAGYSGEADANVLGAAAAEVAGAGVEVVAAGIGQVVDRAKDLPRKLKEARRKPDFIPSRTRPTGELGGKPLGTRTPNSRNARSDGKRDIELENEAVEAAARNGYLTVQNPVLTDEQRLTQGIRSTKNPDALIEGKIFDVKAPKSASGAETQIADKVREQQSRRFLINTDDFADPEKGARELARALRTKPIEGLQEVKVLVNGKIRNIYP